MTSLESNLLDAFQKECKEIPIIIINILLYEIKFVYKLFGSNQFMRNAICILFIISKVTFLL